MAPHFHSCIGLLWFSFVARCVCSGTMLAILSLSLSLCAGDTCASCATRASCCALGARNAAEKARRARGGTALGTQPGPECVWAADPLAVELDCKGSVGACKLWKINPLGFLSGAASKYRVTERCIAKSNVGVLNALVTDTCRLSDDDWYHGREPGALWPAGRRAVVQTVAGAGVGTFAGGALGVGGTQESGIAAGAGLGATAGLLTALVIGGRAHNRNSAGPSMVCSQNNNITFYRT